MMRGRVPTLKQLGAPAVWANIFQIKIWKDIAVWAPVFQKNTAVWAHIFQNIYGCVGSHISEKNLETI